MDETLRTVTSWSSQQSLAAFEWISAKEGGEIVFKRMVVAAVSSTVLVGLLLVGPVFAGEGHEGSGKSGYKPGYRPGWGFGDKNHPHIGPPGWMTSGEDHPARRILEEIFGDQQDDDHSARRILDRIFGDDDAVTSAADHEDSPKDKNNKAKKDKD